MKQSSAELPKVLYHLFIILSLTILLKTFPTQKLPNNHQYSCLVCMWMTLFVFLKISIGSEFPQFLNSRNPNLNFTIEKENMKQLSFLDVLNTRSDRFITSGY